jgi:hypothetical protein
VDAPRGGQEKRLKVQGNAKGIPMKYSLFRITWSESLSSYSVH